MRELTKDDLTDLYVSKKMTYKEIALHIGRSVDYVKLRMKWFDITPRKSGGMKGKPLKPEHCKKISDANKGKPKTEEHKAKLSVSKQGSRHPNFGKRRRHHGTRHWFTCPNGQCVSMRSSWEVAYAKYLNANNIDWEYEPQTFVLQSGEAYTPDFFLKDCNQWVEVKGWLTPAHNRKMDAWRKEHPNKTLILADRAYLTSLGIDLKQAHISSRPIVVCLECGTDFHRKYPSQQLCGTYCRNAFISKGGRLERTHKPKRKYNGCQRGENNAGSKLTATDVSDIREMRQNGVSVSKIATIKNASTSNIYNILSGRSWSSL